MGFRYAWCAIPAQAEHPLGSSALVQIAPQTPSLPREIKRREKLEKELREVKAALKARADEVASKEEDIAAGEERLRLAESKLHDTKVRADVLQAVNSFHVWVSWHLVTWPKQASSQPDIGQPSSEIRKQAASR